MRVRAILLVILFAVIPCWAEIIYVNNNATGVNNGLSWGELKGSGAFFLASLRLCGIQFFNQRKQRNP